MKPCEWGLWNASDSQAVASECQIYLRLNYSVKWLHSLHRPCILGYVWQKTLWFFKILKFFFNCSYVYSIYFGTSKIYQSLFRSLDIILSLKKNKCLSKLSRQSVKDDPSLKLFCITLSVYQDGRHIFCSISTTIGDCKNLWAFMYSFSIFSHCLYFQKGTN